MTLLPLLAQAQTQASEVWARATVTHQKSGGVFLSLRSEQGARLLGARSPLAGRVEIHEMRMEGDTMRMRALEHLELPAGQVVALKPGGLHLMLLELKEPLKGGAKLPLTLLLQGKDGKPETLELQVPVQAHPLVPMKSPMP